MLCNARSSRLMLVPQQCSSQGSRLHALSAKHPVHEVQFPSELFEVYETQNVIDEALG